MVVGKEILEVMAAEVRNVSWGPTGWQGRRDKGDEGAQENQFCFKSLGLQVKEAPHGTGSPGGRVGTGDNERFVSSLPS